MIAELTLTDVVRAQDGQHELDRLGLEDAVAVLGVGEVEHDRLVERGDGVRDDAARDLRYRHRHAVLFGVEDAVEVDVDVGHLQILTLEEFVDQLLLALVFDVVVGDISRPVGVVGIDRNGQIEHIGQNLFQHRDDRTAHSVQSAGEVGLALGDLRAEDIVVRVARNTFDVVADVDRNGGKHARIVLTRDALDAVDDDLLDLDEVGEVDRILLIDLDELIDLESGLHCLVEHRGKLLVSDLEHLFSRSSFVCLSSLSKSNSSLSSSALSGSLPVSGFSALTSSPTRLSSPSPSDGITALTMSAIVMSQSADRYIPSLNEA